MRGQVWLLNVWASWCAPCLVEHPELLKLARAKTLPLIGFNYKDEPGAAVAWLDKHGNPYTTIVADRNGRAAFDYGVYGVPETFLIDRNGTIRYKHVGPLTVDVIANKRRHWPDERLHGHRRKIGRNREVLAQAKRGSADRRPAGLQPGKRIWACRNTDRPSEQHTGRPVARAGARAAAK